MKVFLSVAALAVLVAMPAHAKTARATGAQYSPNTVVPWDAVIDEGKVIGQDPDANVRRELRRDYPSINH
jgi:hypothetical protein